MADSDGVAFAASSAGTPSRGGTTSGPALDVLSDLLTCGRRSRLWSRLVEDGRVATWVEAAPPGRFSAWRANFSSRSRLRRASSRLRWKTRSAKWSASWLRRGADGRGTGPLATPARSGLAVGAGRPRRARRRAGPGRGSGTTGGPGRTSTGCPPWPSRPTTSRRVAARYLVDTLGLTWREWSVHPRPERPAIVAVPAASARSGTSRPDPAPAPPPRKPGNVDGADCSVWIASDAGRLPATHRNVLLERPSRRDREAAGHGDRRP